MPATRALSATAQSLRAEIERDFPALLEAALNHFGSEPGDELSPSDDFTHRRGSLPRISSAGSDALYLMATSWVDMGAEGGAEVVGMANLAAVDAFAFSHFTNMTATATLYRKIDSAAPAALLIHGGHNGGINALTLHVC